jgi:hypothetical protein
MRAANYPMPAALTGKKYRRKGQPGLFDEYDKNWVRKAPERHG